MDTIAQAERRRWPAGVRKVLSAVLAGAISTAVFTWLHEVLISDIWNTLPMMVAVAGLTGVCLVWSYTRLFGSPTVGSWIGYNLLHVGLLALLGLASLAVFEPITTVPEVLAGGGAPSELIRLAMPLSVMFIVVGTAGIWWLWGESVVDAVAVLLTCTVLVLLLGVNLSVLGLVHLTSDGVYLVGLFLGLILALDLVFAASFAALEWRWFRPRT